MLGTWSSLPSKTALLNDCDEDRCNDPRDPELGCPSMIIERPPQTRNAEGKSNTVPPLEELMAGGTTHQEDGPPWGIIMLGVGVILLVCLFLALLKCMVKEEVSPLYCSDKAKQVAGDTFVEPEQDHVIGSQLGDCKEHGVVKPRPFALKAALNEDKLAPRVIQEGRGIAINDEAEMIRLDYLKRKENEAEEKAHLEECRKEEEAAENKRRMSANTRQTVRRGSSKMPALNDAGQGRASVAQLPGAMPALDSGPADADDEEEEGPIVPATDMRPAAYARAERQGKSTRPWVCT